MDWGDRIMNERLKELINIIVPYVTATLSEGCTFPSSKRNGWREVHEGRMKSSINQLEELLEEANKEN